ncbi:glycerophosphodiester phosphodiesterase [Effusibacillus pohliae]|uniref:glycerophosphodiester phosphodiesterase n=1 Tax=Effusibacillus pohliae TaxID=232270 RepID=UPI00058E69A1|nr:glycerophosphodiester phosphodiesterase family protein [Effusibacillus pohliae]
MIIAHRGASVDAPENTLAAFKLAIEQGAQGVEFDVHLTSDKKLCVIHDHTLERTTNLTGPVFAKTMNELQNADAGSWKHPRFRGEKVPEMEEVLSLYTEGTFVNLEIKNGPIFYEGIAKIVSEKILPWKNNLRFLISSFDHKVLEEVYRADPTLPLGILFEARLYNLLSYIRSLPFPVYSCNVWHHYVTPAFVDALHREGIAVYTYTVDKMEDVERMASAGVDGIITNVPGTLVRMGGLVKK